MKIYTLVEIAEGSKTGNKIQITEAQFESLNITKPFKVHKNKDNTDIAIDSKKFLEIQKVIL